ncbi:MULTISPECIES: hypothetical protein [Prevotellaceae]|nr:MULTISPECIES: hypothetical protein [Prevotellaceae]
MITVISHLECAVVRNSDAIFAAASFHRLGFNRTSALTGDRHLLVI